MALGNGRPRSAAGREIAQLIAADDALATRDAIVRSLPGAGPVLGPVLLAGLAELGQDHPKGLASLAGVAPHTQQSGTRKERGTIQGGRVTICKTTTPLLRSCSSGGRTVLRLGVERELFPRGPPLGWIAVLDGRESGNDGPSGTGVRQAGTRSVNSLIRLPERALDETGRALTGVWDREG